MLGQQQLGDIILGGLEEEEGSPLAHGQAVAQIIAFDVTRHGQAQASILQTYYVVGQTQAHLANVYQVHAQAQAYILGINYPTGQTQSQIKRIYYVHGQSQAKVEDNIPDGLALGQAQAVITHQLLLDTFSRETWYGDAVGTPDIGPAWVDEGNDWNYVRVDGEKLRFLNADYDFAEQYLYNNISAADVDFTGRFYLDNISDFYIFLAARVVGFTENVWVAPQYVIQDIVGWTLRTASGTQNFPLNIPITSERWYKFHLQTEGTTLRFNIWYAEDNEPVPWYAEKSGATAGQSGRIHIYLSDSNDAGWTYIDDISVRSFTTSTIQQKQVAQAAALISVPYVGQAQALIDVPLRYAQAQGFIFKGSYFGVGQAQATIIGQYYQLLDTVTRDIDPTEFDVRILGEPEIGKWHYLFANEPIYSTNNRLEHLTLTGTDKYLNLETAASATDITAYFDFFSSAYGVNNDFAGIYFVDFPFDGVSEVYFYFAVDWLGDNVPRLIMAFDDGEIYHVTTFTAGITYRMLVHMNNGIFQAKVWDLSTPEPNWQLETAHDGFTARYVGFEYQVEAVATSWTDNFTVLVPTVPIVLQSGNAQALIHNTLRSGQARASIKATINRHGQARARIIFKGVHGQARAFIKRPWVHGQARARIKNTFGTEQGQANALISSLAKQKFGQAAAFISSEIHIEHGQANALITNPSYYLVDTFTRVEPVGSMGDPDIGPTWEPVFDLPENFDYTQVDGSRLFLDHTLDDYVFIWPHSDISIKNAELTADLYINGTGYTYLEFSLRANNANTSLITAYYNGDGEWGLTSFGPAPSANGFGYSLIEPHRTYHVRMIVLDSRVRFKVWDSAYDEPETWTIDRTDTYLTAAAGTSFYLDSDSSNTDVYLDNYIVRQAATEQFGQARAAILGGILINTVSGQAQATIKAFDVVKHGQARPYINSAIKNQYAQTQARIKISDIENTGQAQGYIELHRRPNGQAQAYIGLIEGYKTGQAQALVYRPEGYGQAQALIDKSRVYGQAQAMIFQSSRVYGQAQAFIFKGQQFGQAQGKIIGAPRKVGQAQAFIAKLQASGQAQAYINKFIRYSHGQASVLIVLTTNIAVGYALATIVKAQPSGQAQAQIISFRTLASGNAQAQILAPVTRYGQGQAAARIHRPQSIGQAAALIEGAKYLVRYNGYDLPGYAQEEALESVQEIFRPKVIYIDSSLDEYTGLKNKIMSLRMRTVGEDYLAVKAQVRKAATMVRSGKGYKKLYIQQPFKHYVALTDSINVGKTVGTTMRMLDYTVSWEVKPWLVSDITHTISGVNILTTDAVNRDMSNGGWTPARVTVDGTNVTVSGYTTTGDLVGYFAVSGSVNNLIIDTERYTATIDGVNVNNVMYNANYEMYVGPGETTYVITGATRAEISYEDRWYL